MKYISILVIVLFSACMQPIKIGQIKNFKINELSADAIKTQVTLTVKNPNFFGIKMIESDLTLMVNAKNLGPVKFEDDLEIPANSEKEYIVKIILEKPDYLNTFVTFLSILSQKKAKVKLEGTITAKSMIFTKEVKISEENTIEIFN